MKGKIKYCLAYVTLLIPSVFIGEMAFDGLAQGTLYYCSDYVPWLPMFPPFIHEGAPGDHYIIPPLLIYATWLIYLILPLSAPAFILRQIRQRSTHSAIKWGFLSLPVAFFLKLIFLILK